MAYEPNAHDVQMKLLREMLFVPKASFATLQKATGLTSDHANFHIKKLVDVGYVEKTDDGYVLTREGKEYANRMDTDEVKIEKQPKISVLLIVDDKDGKSLAQQRLKQPYYGFWGRMSGKVRWGETLEEAANRELQEETGLTADFHYSGLYHKMDYTKDGEMLEDKYFLVMYGVNPRGEFIADAEGHHNEFLSMDELLEKEKRFQMIPEVTEFAKQGAGNLFEKKHEYKPEDY